MLVGLSMALAIAICIGGFIWIYVRVGPIFSDFIPQSSNSLTPVVLSNVASPQAATPAAQLATIATPTPVATISASPTVIWEATHKIVSGETVNFRGGPTTNSDVVDVLPPGTDIKFIGEQQQTSGVTWMHFQEEDGTEGWVREVDVTPLTP
jgi:uncharacterized protein YgiM (DUF1202 family)